MSAFMVGTDHVDLLVSAALDLPGVYGPLRWEAGEDWYQITEESAGLIGAMLLAENRRSVDYRYQESELEEPYLFTRVPRSCYDAVAVLKAFDCYEYQACEHPEWRGSESRNFCDSLRRTAVNRLPGYAAAAWEWAR